MAEHKQGEMDVKDHEKMFDAFIGWTKWAVIAILIIIVGMAIFIT